MIRLLTCSLLLATVLESCSLQQIFQPKETTVLAYRNPHILCVNCHAIENPQSGSMLFNPGTDHSSFCLKCHKDYRSNHHPVDFTPDDPSSFQLPLFEGKVRCLSCHEIHGGAENKGTPKLLRGGPYADRRETCFKCHTREQYAGINPHKMLDGEGNIRLVNNKPVCLICKSVMPNPAVDRANDVKFRADVGFLCWRCHPPMPGSFFDKHFLVRPSAAKLQTLRETEERLVVILPLVPRGRITCATCHNPHEKGIMQREDAGKGADAVARLRMPSICFGCHRM